MQTARALIFGAPIALSLAFGVVLLDAREPRQAQKAVLVTGATSGIGRNITERLASKGYFVYAGARSESDMKALNAIPNVQAIRLDVTIASDIANAVATVTKAGRGLYGVVNNAGVVIVAPLVEADEKDMDFIFSVNLYGPYRITKAFAPLLFESKGRVVNIENVPRARVPREVPALSGAHLRGSALPLERT